MSGLQRAVLRLAVAAAPRADSAEAGLAACARHLGVPSGEIATEIAALVGAALLHDPVQLPDGALHCHWRLQATQSGRDAAKEYT